MNTGEKNSSVETFHASVFLRKMKYTVEFLVGRIPNLDTMGNSFGAGDSNCFDNSCD